MQVPYVVIFESVVPGPCQERALVLQSQAIPTEIMSSESGYQLLVPLENQAHARAELASYVDENVGWKPRQVTPKLELMEARPGLAGYVFLMLFIGWAAGESLLDLSWFEAGKVHARSVMNGEVWRTVTALTLHGDVGHLAGNLGFGMLFGYFAGQFFGSGIGWLAILVSGAVGNTMNSFLQSPSHTSVGASTAIFGALGLVAAYSWRRKWFPQDRWVGRVGPIAGGVALLAFTGTGGERTDVGAHLTGFVSGVLFGALLVFVPSHVLRSPRIQWIAGSLALGGVAGAWYLALGAQ